MSMHENFRTDTLYITNIKLLNIIIIKLKSSDQENESDQREGLALICYNKCLGWLILWEKSKGTNTFGDQLVESGGNFRRWDMWETNKE